jgi:Prenyltransferase and squalene oxidase repeat
MKTALLFSLIFIGRAAAQDGGDVFRKYEADVSRAVNRGFEYLLSVEQKDGSFPDSHGRSTGISSLVGMSFLAKGHTPGNGRYGEALNRRIDFALNCSRENGLVDNGDHGNGPMYAHNISTLFLSEVSGMVDESRQKKIDEVLPKAMEIILRAQAVKKEERHQGGWRYHPNSTDSDLSCSGWALMALRSARLNGAPVPPQAIESAVQYVLRQQERKQGHFGYMDEHQHRDSLTGAALLSLELCGRHASPESLLAGNWILENYTRLPSAEFELYGNYYNAQGTFQLGGKYWKTYASWMYPHYLEEQDEDGSWKDSRFGRAYGTAMMILAFTVPGRQLPIYQRDERIDEE